MRKLVALFVFICGTQSMATTTPWKCYLTDSEKNQLLYEAFDLAPGQTKKLEYGSRLYFTFQYNVSQSNSNEITSVTGSTEIKDGNKLSNKYEWSNINFGFASRFFSGIDQAYFFFTCEPGK
jgi:hypothetical protein